MGSDHFPVVITVDEGITVEETHRPRWLFKKADWNAFKTDCRRLVTVDLIGEDIESSYSQLTERLLKVATDHIPRSRPNGKLRGVPYWKEACTRAVKERNAARNQMQRTKNGADIEQYRRLRGLAQKTIREAQRSHWREYCGTLNDRTKMGHVWKTVRRMSGVSSKSSIPTLTTADKRKFVDNQSKAELFAKCFADVSSNGNHCAEFQARKTLFEEDHRQELHGVRRSIDGEGDPVNVQFEYHSLQSALLRRKKSTSPGEDEISSEILAHLPKPSVLALLKMFNLIWERGTLPAAWKRAIVIPVQKPNKPAHEQGSYRPIALTSVLCKVMERLVTDRLTWLLESESKLNKFQSGFRKQRSCQDHIVRLADDIQRAL